MRVCMIVYSFYEMDTRVMQYATALANRGDSVDIVCLRRENSPTSEVIRGVNVCRIQSRRIDETGRFTYLFRILRFWLVSFFVVTRRHFSSPYQIIHVHSVPDFLVFSALVPRLLGARIILDIHDILPEFYASKFAVSPQSLVFRILVQVEKASIAFAHHVIIANHLWQDRLTSRSVSAEKCSVFVNYPDPCIFYRRAKQPGGGKFTILYPGSLNRHQGLDIAIRAFARVAAKMPEAEFHIYGEGPDKSCLAQLSEDLLLTDRVFLHEYVATEEIAGIMAMADLAVVPKRASSAFGNEAVSTKIMEFMSLGVPLIVSRTKIDSFYHDDSRIQFFESENIEDLARSLLLLWSSPETREKLVASGDKYIAQNSWEVKKLDYFSLVDRLLPVRPVNVRFASPDGGR